MWVRAIERYHNIYKSVEPKKQRVNEAQALLDNTKAKLLEKQHKLGEIEDKLSGLLFFISRINIIRFKTCI